MWVASYGLKWVVGVHLGMCDLIHSCECICLVLYHDLVVLVVLVLFGDCFHFGVAVPLVIVVLVVLVVLDIYLSVDSIFRSRISLLLVYF